MKFYIADAFANELFGGNPAGVVIIPDGMDYPDDEAMRKTAAELRYSETAFLRTISPNEFDVRYFTPAAEVDLCGHATIASFYCLAKSGLIEITTDNGNITSKALAHTLAGDIEITVDYTAKDTDDIDDTEESKNMSAWYSPSFVMMDMAEPKHIYTIKDAIELDRLYEIMGSEFDQSIGLYPMIISTGLPDIIMPVSNRAELNSLKPDFEALTKLSEAYKVTGVHAFAIEPNDSNIDNEAESSSNSKSDFDITCLARNFAPLYEIDEEAATGTANGALTFYLCLNQKIGTQARCRVIQGEAMGRPSEILTTIDAGETCKIKVGGGAKILAEGEINL